MDHAGDREGERQPDRGPAKPRGESDQEQEDHRDDDDRADEPVRCPGVVPGLVQQLVALVLQLVFRVERAITCRTDLSDHAYEDDRCQVLVDRSERVHRARDSLQASAASASSRSRSRRRRPPEPRPRPPGRSGRSRTPRWRSVRHLEARLLDRLEVVDLGAPQVGSAERVDDDGDPVGLELVVALLRTLVEAERVLEARATAALDGDAEHAGLAFGLLGQEALDLRRRALGEHDQLVGALGDLHGGIVPAASEVAALPDRANL